MVRWSSTTLLAAATALLCPLGTATAQQQTKYLFIFGDSYTATGFNPSGAKPSPANPIGNPALPGSTFSGGWDWPGYLVTAFNTSQTLAYNFAVGGATVDSNLVAPPGNGILSFVEQIGRWQGIGLPRDLGSHLGLRRIHWLARSLGLMIFCKSTSRATMRHSAKWWSGISSSFRFCILR